MDLEYLENRIIKLLAESNKLEVDIAYNQIEWSTWKTDSKTEHPPTHLIEEEDELIKPFKKIIESLHQSVICYLDALGLNEYLALFLL